MRKEEKTQIINSLSEQLQASPNFYIADTSGLNAENTSKLRRLCFEKNIKLVVAKNTFLRKALEQNGFGDESIYSVLEGPTAIMFCETANAPAKLIKDFSKKHEKPVLKGAYVQECVYLGKEMLEELVNIKSREELIGDIIGMLQSPAKNVISALQSSGDKLAGIVKTLSERPE